MANDFKTFHGIAVEDRAMQSRKLKVFLREMTPFGGGDLADKTQNETYSINDENGKKSTGSVSTTNCIVADYFGLSTNSAFPPDIVAGEQVIVLQYADEDNYYWIPAGRDDNLRKTELSRWQISNSGASELTEANTYFVELDSKLAKRIRIHSSKSDGEAFGYDINIDAKNKHLTITDDVGNSIIIESEKSGVIIKNAEGTTINLNKTAIQIMAPQMVYIKSPSIVLDGALTMKGTANSAGNTDHTGEMNITGKLTVNGNNIS